MRVRVIELRILGVALAALWVVAFGLICLGYRPGGPIDLLVGLSSTGPILVAVAAIAWPPVARSERAFAMTAWVAMGAALLLVPSIARLVVQLQGRGPQTLLPSLEAAYPWVLALGATSQYAGLGLARRRFDKSIPRRRRLLWGSAVGLALLVAGGGPFAAAAVVNELAVANRPAISSRFGPTDPALEPPSCSGPLIAGTSAVLSLQMDTAIDGTTTGLVTLAGVRSGSDVQWSGFSATRFVLGQRGFVRIGTNAWDLGLGAQHSAVSAAPASKLAGWDLDAQLVGVALTMGGRAAAEDNGLSFIEGARARHCRIALDGATLRQALPEVDLLVGDADLARWRGELDFWVFGDGQLGQADGHAGGPALGLAYNALLASIRFRMTAIDRGLPVTIVPPGS